jgi:hypothetical protein
MRTLRALGSPVLAALAFGLAVLPAEGQTAAPFLPTANGEWDEYLAPPASTDETVAERGGRALWRWAGIGAVTMGAGGVFSYYLKHDFFAPYPPAARGTPGPAAPGIRDPGPVASKPGQTGGDTDPPSVPPKDGEGAVPDSTSTSPTDNTFPGGEVISEPQPPKIGPVAPPGPGDDVPTTVTPEPSTLVLLLSGFLGFFFVQRRRRRA